MMDYSLPVARRTRQGQALIFKQYNEEKKKGKERKGREQNNGVESVSSSGRGRANGEELAEMVKGVSGSDRLGANYRIETESETVAVSDSSVEEIGGNDWGEEGSGVGEESMGLKNNENSNMGFEGMVHVDEIVVDDSEDDEVVFLGEGDMNCSSLRSGAERDEGVVYIDVDDGDVLSGEDVNNPSGLNSDGRRGSDEMAPSLTRKGESSCLNFDYRKSSGVVGRTLGFLKRNEDEDGGNDAVWGKSYASERNKDEHGDDNVVLDGLRRNEDDDGGGKDVSVDSVGTETSLESSSSEEGSDDEDYNVGKLESCGESSSSEEASDDEDYKGEKLGCCGGCQQLSSDSRVEEEKTEEDAEGREIMKGGSRKRGRPKGVDVGLKRRKYGLDILVDSENEEDSINDDEDGSLNISHELYCVAQRTRSKKKKKKKKKMEAGTFSHPLCIDEEEVESSSGHDDSDDSGDDIVGSEEYWSNYENEDNFSDDEPYHGSKKTLSCSGKFKTNKGYDDECVQKVHVRDEGKLRMSCSGKFKTNKGYDDECVQKVHVRDEGKLRTAAKGKSIDLVKNCNALKILVDSILEKGEVPLEELESSKDDACKDENYSAVAKMSLPLKFTFGVVESNPSKKSEDQKEMAGLWADFELALICSEIGSVDPAKVEDEDSLPPKNGSDRATLCHVGNHELILDEQVGLRCAFCSYIKMEIKYILPSFSTHPCGKSDRRDPGGEMNHSIFDDLWPQDSGCDSHSVYDRQAHSEATVWDIIPGIKSSMYPHQRDGFEFIWKNIAGGIYLDKLKNQTTSGGSGCIISHAPGTGKTRLTIVFLQTYMKLHPTCRPVIVAPLSLLLTWEEEFRKWKFDIPFHNLNQSKLSGKESLTNIMEDNLSLNQGGHLDQSVIRLLKVYSWKLNSSILGISYNLFGQLAGTALFREVLLEVPGIVVLDEGHIPRNLGSLILKALSNIKTDKRIILSGTPFQNNFDELYNTLCLARPEFTRIRGKWESLTSPITKGTNDRRLKSENLKKVRDMIDPFVHVHKGSILQEKLPGLRDSLVILQPTQLQKSLFGELSQHITRSHSNHLNHFKSDFLKSLISVHPSLLLKCGEEEFPSERDRLKGLNHEAGVKTNFLVELIRLSKALNEKVLVFSQYLEPLTFIMDQLKFLFNWTEGNEVLYMHGHLEAKQRQSSINIFNDPTSEAKVLLASIKACSEGINLVGASRVVLLDVVWNPSVERQAISRAHRLGQEKVVYIYHLIATGTNEEEKYCRQVEKDLLSELVFSSSGGSGDQQKISPLVSDDKILEEMVQHEKLRHIFEKIQQKESKLI